MCENYLTVTAFTIRISHTRFDFFALKQIREERFPVEWFIILQAGIVGYPGGFD
jgi:hypothetical protein